MIHLYDFEGQHIVLDTCSGGIHVLDGVSFSVLRALVPYEEAITAGTDRVQLAEIAENNADLDGYEPEQIQTALDEIYALIREGTLFSKDVYAEIALDLRERQSDVKALCLNVAHTCNLDCEYCFASQGKYHGERALMSAEVAKRAIDFLIAHSGAHRNLDIDFFGGEPLLNWEVVKETVRYARSIEKAYGKNFRFTLTTNGILLDEEIGAFLNQHMHNVVLSLDGRKEVHDRLRHSMDGRGSYDRIVPRFQRFVQSRGEQEYYIRGTFTKNNLDFTEDVLHMANLGFYRLSMEPVIGDPAEPYMLGPADRQVLEAQYERLAREMICRDAKAEEWVAAGRPLEEMPPEDHPFLFYHFMLDLEAGPCIYKRIAGCGSGTEYLAVTPWGDLFPCHQFVGDAPYALGNVFEGIQRTDLVRSFQQCNCYSHSECQSCWARLYCSGGCAANALHATGQLTGTVPFSCDLFRKRIECAIGIKVAALLREAQQ